MVTAGWSKAEEERKDSAYGRGKKGHVALNHSSAILEWNEIMSSDQDEGQNYVR